MRAAWGGVVEFIPMLRNSGVLALLAFIWDIINVSPQCCFANEARNTVSVDNTALLLILYHQAKQSCDDHRAATNN